MLGHAKPVANGSAGGIKYNILALAVGLTIWARVTRDVWERTSWRCDRE